MRKKNQSDNNDESRPNREPDFRLVAKIVFVIATIGIIVSTILIFTPPVGKKGYAELGLVVYNGYNEEFEAYNYPTRVYYNQTTKESNNVSVYLIVGNHYSEAKFYEVRMKIGLQSLLIDDENPGTNSTTYFYTKHWKKHIFAIEETWGPSTDTKITFNFQEEILTKLGINSDGYKIIFELWEWNDALDTFSYTGIYVYLTSFQVILVS
ncbi:MAG: hypothetical protein GF308_03745 [Candidatus Heimdallarchaeota archaeon]|nr:hypothetical protein [Candidatus Heimdallarchaeota archaeon]